MSALRLAARLSRDEQLRRGVQHYARKGSWPGQIMPSREEPKVSSVQRDAPRAPRYGAELVKGQHVLRGVRATGTSPSVTLVLPEVDTARIYAGVKTAITAAGHVAAALGRPLRVVPLVEPAAGSSAEQLGAWLRTNVQDGDALAARVSLVAAGRLAEDPPHPEDVWVPTYWTTALAVADGVHTGLVDRQRVVYLVQDFEPAFNPWGDRYALAASTYRQGFAHLVNSQPLSRYLAAQLEQPVDERHVFAPDVDLEPVRAAAAAWRPGDPAAPRVLFYARPRHPRNLYRIGLEALRIWVDRLARDGVRPQVVAAGDDVEPVDLGNGLLLQGVGKVSLQEYYAMLSRVDVGLALMHSPHPSHLPLELAGAGVPTVTNTLGSYRSAWQPGLVLADPEPRALADGLAEAWRRAAGLERHEPADPQGLGRPLPDAVRDLLRDRGLLGA
ncbi:hypothetical protein [Vallicoccus soli]|uniref:Glycosyltransferase family 1 protein n=1 Tax=Vallicoccus soli TaxID=2339232 RepID=A0A3A3ZIR6_9ACTN|nr:hypothetical protein [Vallicoccus soli]RJK95352.1 hypothetical protein D5H78_11855 [Vallicoccus soli]